ncbi:MAG: hypothetical protein V4608_10935 [Bacteroidota bacterium]
MTTDEFVQKLNAKIQAIEKEDKPLQIAVRSIMALQSKRIFLEGKNSSEGNIGEYSKKNIYVSDTIRQEARIPKFPLKGKNGKEAFKNGNKHKSGYFENYLGFKTSIGRNKRIKTVDLFLSGDLHNNWANSEVVGKANAIRVNQHNYTVLLSEKNQNKAKRYGRVFNLSANEKSKFLLVIQSELAKALR